MSSGTRAAVAIQKPLPKHRVYQSMNQRCQEPSPPLPAVARAMVGRLSPAPPHSHVNPHPPSPPHPPQPPLSPIVPALAKKLALQTNPKPPPHILSTHSTSHPLPAVACRLQQPHSTPRHSPSCPSPHPPPLPNLTPSQEHTGMKFPTQPPQVVARQQTILHQLAILREVYISDI